MRIGILGAARITPQALIQPAAEVEGVELSVVAARDAGRARAFAGEHGVAAVVDDYAAVISADVDAVYNPLPISAHASWTIAALRAGKHVLCEKPFTMNADEAREVVAVARETGLVCMEAFHWRFHPLATRVREILDGDLVGKVASIDAAFTVPIPDTTDIRHQLALGGGATMDLGCYAVQWARFAAGGRRPTVVSATAVEGAPGIDLSLTGQLRWDDGATGTVHADMSPDAGFRAELVVRGSAGTLTVTNPLAPQLGNRLVVEQVRAGRNGGGPDGVVLDESAPTTPTYTHQLQHFVDVVTGVATDPITGGDDAVDTMAVIDDLYLAAGLPRRGA